jgi:predicted ATPase
MSRTLTGILKYYLLLNIGAKSAIFMGKGMSLGKSRQLAMGTLSLDNRRSGKENMIIARRQCLMPVILACQEAEISRITAQSQPRQIVHKTLSLK